MIKDKKLEKLVKKNNQKVQEFFDIKEIKNNHILTVHGEELYYIKVTPKNISVLSKESITAIVNDLSIILAALPKSELLCLDNFQSYKDNKAYLNKLAESENNPSIKSLNLLDIEHMDNVKLNMATSRAFYFLIRHSSSEPETEKNKSINNVLQICKENNFDVSLANKKEIKKMLAIYLEQNTYTEDYPDYDGQQYSDELNSEKFNLHSFVDLVAPSITNLKAPNYYIVGNTYRKVWAVRQFATLTEDLALLKELGEKEGVSLHIYNRVLNDIEQGKIFDKAERRNVSNFINSKSLRNKVEGQENLSDIEKLLKESHRTHENFVFCAIFIELITESPEELKNLSISVEQILRANKIKKDNLILQQLKGFISVAPFGFNDFGTEFERVMPMSSAANLFPISYSGKTDKKGIYIGKDVNGSNIIVDFDKRDSDKTNGHISIWGNSGEGKSYLMKLLMCIFRQQKKLIYSLDVDDEYRELTDNLNGTNLDMMSGKFFINPLQPKISKDDEEQKKTSSSILSQHIAFLKNFFSVYCPGINETLLEIMLVKTYDKFKINEKTDLTTFPADKFPILSDLYSTTENELNFYDDNVHKAQELIWTKSDCRKLLSDIYSICVGSDSLYFNGTTNIPNSEHINFIIKEVLTTNERLKNTMYLNIFSFMQHQYFTNGETAVFFDELHEIIKSFIVVEYIRSFIKRGRKKDSNVVLASQNLDDLMLPDIIEYTRSFFSIPTHMFMFYPGKVEKERFLSISGMTGTEYNLIDRSRRGFCFYSCGNEKYHIQIIVPEHKAKLFGKAGGR